MFDFCYEHRIVLETRWIPREFNEEADQLCKTYDHDDWAISDWFFAEVSHSWGPFTVDRFASASNNKCKRFNSKFYWPTSEQVDAFSISWDKESNCLVPPVSLVPKVLQHMSRCSCSGVLIVPFWPSASFWPFIVDDRVFSASSSKSIRCSKIQRDQSFIPNTGGD